MPRQPADLPAGPRLTDYLAVGLLAKEYTVKNVRIALARTGKMSVRERDLPNHVVVYLVILMAIYAKSSYDAILELLLQGFELAFGTRLSVKSLNKSALSRGRERVGWEPLAFLFESCKPRASQETRGAWYRGLRLVILDGTRFDAADTPENAKYFGYPKGTARGAFPQVQATFLCEAGTHLVFGAAISGEKRESEIALAYKLLPKLKKDHLLICDRLYPSFKLLKSVQETGAQSLWRVKNDIILQEEEMLPDGSYISTLHEYDETRHRKRGGLKVRVIRYTIKGNTEVYRLITTMLDHKSAPAHELAVLYQERWEIENTNDEIKVHLKPAKIPLRSKKPELVIQEIYGFLLAHYLIRRQMHEAALTADEDPDRISFVHSVEVVRAKLPQPGNFSPLDDKMN